MLSQCRILPIRGTVLLAAVLFTAALPTNAQESGEKKAVPDARDQGKAEALITKLFAAQLKEAKTDKAAAAKLAAELLAQGKATNDDNALQFVALKMAGELYAAAGDNAAALDAVDTLARHFQVDTLAMKSGIYTQAEKGLTDKDAAIDLIEAVLNLIEEALAADNFAVADKLLATADKAVVKSGKLALASRVEKRGKEVEDARKAFEAVKPLLGKEGKELEVGKYYCFTKGNYAKGLPLLAKSKDATLKALAERDLAKPQEPKKQIDLADDWHKLAEENKGLAQRQTFRRALHWYAAALPKLEGLTRVRVERQVTELAKLFPGGSGSALPEITGELRTFQPHMGQAVQAVAISADGKLLLTCSQSDTTVRLWDATTGMKKKDLTGHTGGPLSVAFSPDGKWGLSGATDNTVRLWNLETGQEVRRFNGHAGLAYVVRFLPDGKQVMSGSGDGAIRIFDVGTGNLVKTLTGHTQLVHGLGISKDGKRLISGSYDQTARVWDLEKSTEIHRFSHGGAIHHAALSPDGKRAVTAGLDFAVKIWDVDAGKELHTLAHQGLVYQVVISPDGRRVYTGGGGAKKIPVNKDTCEIRVWDLQTGKELRQLKGHSNFVYGLAMSANGRFLVSGSHDASVRVWGAK